MQNKNVSNEIINSKPILSTQLHQSSGKGYSVSHQILADTYRSFYKAQAEEKYFYQDLFNALSENTNIPYTEVEVNIDINLADEIESSEIEEDVIKAIQEDFKYRREVENLNLKLTYKKAGISALVSVLGLIIVFITALGLTPQNISGNVVIEIIKVGSWMCMWQALLFISFNRSEHKEQLAVYNKLIAAKVHFRYGNKKFRKIL